MALRREIGYEDGRWGLLANIGLQY